MINFAPIFPLNIVVFPGEPLNLHIFEERYKQLITECITEKKPFGIPCVLNKKMEEYGTLMEITEVVKTYENGEMDIRTRGVKIFRILEVIKEIPDKLYCGAIVDYPQNVMEPGDSKISFTIRDEVKRLFTLLDVEEKFPDKTALSSYEIGHFLGFSLEQEYELLNIFTEIQRMEYIRRHLNSMKSVINELEQVKARVKMNGHFRNLSLDDFNL